MMPLLAVVLLGVSGWEPEVDQAQQAAIPAGGFEWFSYLLGFPGWQGGPPVFLTTVDEALQSPRATMIMCVGPVGLLEEVDLFEFVQKGGALIIATEQPATPGVESLLWKTLGTVPTGNEVYSASPENPEHAYQTQEICPRIQATGNNKHPWFFRDNQESKPATNRPTAFRKGHPAVQMGEFCGAVIPNQPKYITATTDVGNGRIGLLGDASIFTNLMLQAPDNINFALNVTEWAREGKNQTRSRLLLIVDGAAVPRPFTPPLILPPLPMPNPETLLDKLYQGAEGLVQGVEKGLDDMDNRDALNQSAQQMIPPNCFVYLVGLLTILLAGIFVRLLAGSTSRSQFVRDDSALPQPAQKAKSPVVWLLRTTMTTTGTALKHLRERWRPTSQP